MGKAVNREISSDAVHETVKLSSFGSFVVRQKGERLGRSRCFSRWRSQVGAEQAGSFGRAGWQVPARVPRCSPGRRSPSRSGPWAASNSRRSWSKRRASPSRVDEPPESVAPIASSHRLRQHPACAMRARVPRCSPGRRSPSRSGPWAASNSRRSWSKRRASPSRPAPALASMAKAMCDATLVGRRSIPR